MGWQDETHGLKHEGYVIGLVTRDGSFKDSGLYRALCYPEDKENRPFERVGAECTCGWRSWHWEPLQRAWTGTKGHAHTLEWAPFSPIVGPRDEERAHRLWRKHVSDIDTEQGLVRDDSP